MEDQAVSQQILEKLTKLVEQKEMHPTAAQRLLGETLNGGELADVLGVSERVVTKLRKDGKISYIRVSDRKRLYHINEVRKFLKANTMRAES